MPMRFEVLGPVRVHRDGTDLDLGPRQQRLILALLLANAGRSVSLGDMVDLLWREEPPRSAVNVVHRYVGALRRTFEPDLPARATGRWLAGDATGYRMRVESDDLDLLRLRVLADQARAAESAGRLPEALATYEAALDLWRGPCGAAAELAANEHPAFSLVDHECADVARTAAALALRTDSARSFLPVLRRMAEHRRLDEALHSQLLLTLSAGGHQAEAIALYQTVRTRLAEELGVDPGEDLRDAYQSVLGRSAAEPVVPAEVGPARPGPPSGQLRISRLPVTTAVLPAQLPPDLPYFTGRDEVRRHTLDLVDSRLRTQLSMPVLAIDGPPGIGKTSFAVHLAHQLATAYPDGQLYVDLQGFGPDQSVVRPAEALQGFLNALGIPDADIPAGDHARAGLYRSVLAGRRVLVVLDNAREVEQVRPLLPGAPGCLVLVTSRKRLTQLATAHGAHLTTLDVLSLEDARQVLSSRIGEDRDLADRTTVDEIIGRCGRLPLALAVVAARALTPPGPQLVDIAAELREAQGSLDGFTDGGDDGIRAIFSWSYRMLSAPAARMFRLLSLHPGPDAAVPSLAGLAGVPLAEARRLAGELVRTGLLAEPRVGRFAAHDLIRAYARELVDREEDDRARQDAVRRLVHHYWRTAYEADQLLRPAFDLDPPEAVEGVVIAEIKDAAAAISWLTAERQVLKAVIQHQLESGRVASAWRLVAVLQCFLHREGWWHDWAALTRACLQAATTDADDRGRAHMSRSLAGAEYVLGDNDTAGRLLRQSLDLLVGLGLRRDQALVYRNLGVISDARGEHGKAVECYSQGLRLFESLNDPSGQVSLLCGLAEAHSHLGHHRTATKLMNRALSIAETLDDANRQAVCHATLATCQHAEGDLATARENWTRAAAIYRRTGWRMSRVECLRRLGEAALAMGDPAGARSAWREGLDLLDQQQVPQVDELRTRLAELDRTVVAPTLDCSPDRPAGVNGPIYGTSSPT